MKQMITVLVFMGTVLQGLASELPTYRWRQMRTQDEVQQLPITYSPSAHNRRGGMVYVLDRLSADKQVYAIDLETFVIEQVNSVGALPERIDMYTYESENHRVIVGRSGRDALYTLELAGDMEWKMSYPGTFDSESYGAYLYWNTATSRPAYFGGYGMFRMKNWVWEHDGASWSNVVPDNDQCEPPKRADYSRMIQGDPANHEIFIYSGEGSCSGDQRQQCSDGLAWGGSSFCWLRDIWRFDYENNTFTEVLPRSTTSYDVEGVMGYDYERSRFVLIPLFDPTTYAEGDTLADLSSLLVLNDGASEFQRIDVGGEVPPARTMAEIRNAAVYYDERNDRFVLFRGDGIWVLEEQQVDPCITSADSILGYRNTETHQVVTYALRNKPELSYQWFATGGYLLGETTNHFCDVIWGYDDTGWVCCEVRDDSSCLDTLCINIAIQNGTTGGIAQGEGADRIMSVRPNPTVDLLTVSSVEATDATVYDLVDVTGRIVRQAHGRHVTLSTENIPAGVYHLMMKDGRGLVQAIERVVVQR